MKLLRKSNLFGVLFALLIATAGVSFGAFFPESSNFALAVGIAVFGLSVPLLWSLMNELFAVRLEAQKIGGDQKDALLELIDIGVRQLWALFYLQVAGVLSTIGVMFAKDTSFARSVTSAWAMLAILSICSLTLLPTIRRRIQSWRESAAKFERDKKATDELIERLTKAAADNEKTSPFSLYKEWP